MPTLGYRFMPEQEKVSNAKDQKHYVVKIEDVPHHALIVYSNKYCSGSLITSRTVLTTATCFFNKPDKENIIVKVGASTMTDFGQIINVIDLKIHEYFQRLGEWDNDVALLHLEAHVQFGKVQKVLVVEPEVAIRVNTPLLVSGWGSTNVPVRYINLLLQSEMLVMDPDDCRQEYGGQITPSNYCARYSPQQLLSDNGGSAVLDGYLVGILSAGANNEKDPQVAILTNVSYFHRWIKLNTKRFLKKYCSRITGFHNNAIESDDSESWYKDNEEKM